jgi:hypothetical protein
MLRSAVVLALFALGGCRCSGPADFTAEESAQVCLTLEACSPREFLATWGGSLEFCTTNVSPLVPTPGTLEASPAIATGLDQPMREIYRCLLEAKGDCTKAAACWTLDGGTGACTASPGLSSARCTGNLLSGCTLDGQRFRVDCAHYDAVCTGASFFSSANVCAIARCTSALGCRGSSRELCLGDAVLLADCARDGQVCQAVDGGPPECVSERACAPGPESHCEENVVVFCQPNGFESRTDCARNPTKKRCKAGACVETGTQCVDLRVTCEGTAVSFCADGFTRQVDCVTAGFSGCDAGACVPR